MGLSEDLILLYFCLVPWPFLWGRRLLDFKIHLFQILLPFPLRSLQFLLWIYRFRFHLFRNSWNYLKLFANGPGDRGSIPDRVILLYFDLRPSPKNDTFQWPVFKRDRVGGLRLMIWDKVKVSLCHYSHVPEESNLWTAWQLYPLDDD